MYDFNLEICVGAYFLYIHYPPSTQQIWFFRLMRKRTILLLLALLFAVNSIAQTFESGGIQYKILTPNTVAVIHYKPTYNDYLYYYGDLNVPSSVTHDNVQYSVTCIGDSAFYYCSNLTSITIPSSVTSIGDLAFVYCSELISITIPISVTNIGDYAFFGCIGLSSITIPVNVTNIGNRAFGECTGLNSISVDSSNIVFDSRNNCNAIILTSTNNLIVGCSKTIIPEGITNISSLAFDGCLGLDSIRIPSSVTNIESNAFWGCSGLASISVDSDNIVYDSRNNCNAIILTSKNSLIVGCSKTIIPEGITKIGANAFNRCLELTSLNIPNSVTNIDYYAFWYCSGLTSLTIPNSVTSIGYGAFYCCSGLTSLTIPDNVKNIDELAFSGCSGLTTITLPNSITKIQARTFNGCSGLTSITIPSSVTSIEYGAFSDCSKLTTIIIPSSVTNIGDHAFNETPFYKNIPNGPVYLGHIAYTYKGIMPQNSEIIIPEGITTINQKAFYRQTGLTSITIPNSVSRIGDDAFTGTPFYDNLPDGPIYLGSIAYTYKGTMPQDTKLIIPEGITAINQKAFYGQTGLISITIPNSVINIGDYALYGCNGLTSITIPNSVTNIGNNAFYQCNHIDSLFWYSSVPLSVFTKTYTTIKYVVLGDSVSNINDNDFQYFYKLQSITFNNNITFISNEAFNGCNKIETIFWNSSKVSPYVVTQYCKNNLKNIFLGDSIYCIMDRAFYDCANITTIIIPENVRIIGNEAFKGCSKLTTINIPENVRTIGIEAFKGCSKLTTINIPNNVTDIGRDAFIGTTWYNNQPNGVLYINAVAYTFKGEMPKNSTIVIKEGANIINKEAFKGNQNLKTIKLPSSIKAIGNYAFADCPNLKAICCYAKDCPSVSNDSFSNQERISLYVKSSSLIKYRNDVEWSIFGNINAFVEELDIVVNNKGYTSLYCSDYFDYKLPKGLSAMVISGINDGKLIYETIASGSDSGVIPAGIAVMIVSESKKAGSFRLEMTEYGEYKYKGTNLLMGSEQNTLTYSENSSYFYKLSYGPSGTDLSNDLGWYWGSPDGDVFQIEAHKAWLAIPKTLNTRAMGYSINGTSTELSKNRKNDNEHIYNLSGQKLDNPIYNRPIIINGRKQIIIE